MKSLLPLVALILGACAATPAPAPAPMPTSAVEGVPQSLIEGHRIAGSPFVPLSDSMIVRLHDAGVIRTQARVKLCIGKDGAPLSITFLVSTGDKEADARIRDAVATWRYKPPTVNGSPAPICIKAVFNYMIH